VGQVGGLTATANSSTKNAVMATIVINPAGQATPNQSPTARITSTCSALRCDFEGAGSSDPDGSIASYAWTFGDGQSSTATNPSHTYASAGTYNVSLKVTDDKGATNTATKSVSVTNPAASGISFVGSVADAQDASVVSHTVTVPTTVRAGDALVLTFADNGPNVVITAPSGWTQEGSQSTSGMTSRIWSRVATANDAGSQIRVTTASAVRGDLVLAAYRGTSTTDPLGAVVTAAETVNRATHTTPTASVTTAGSWVASYWADKTAATTSWTAPTGQQVRQQFAGTGAGHTSGLITDGGANAPVGQVGGLTATANSSTSNAVMATIVLNPAS
jgi:PKD repeat protein